jgi:hypothetical protein
MGEEGRIENLEKGFSHSLWEMLQGPVRNSVWARSLAELETPDGFLNLLGLAGRGHELRPQRHVNHLNNCRDRRICHRLELNFQNFGKDFSSLRV